MAKFISDQEMETIESRSPDDSQVPTKTKKILSDDEMAALEISSIESDEILGVPKTTIEGILDSLPVAGALTGGVVGSGLGPVGTVGGAGLGAAGGKAAANAIKSALGISSAPETRSELYGGVVKEGLIGASGEAGGQIIAKAPQLIRQGIRSARQLPARMSGEALVPDVLPPQSFSERPLEQTMKPNAGEIRAATQRLGAEPTRGMISSNQNIQNIENVLSQTPTVAGEKVRQSYDPIRKGLSKAGEEIVNVPGSTQFEAGEQFRAGLTQKVKARAENLGSKFEVIRESSRHIKPSKESLTRTARRLVRQDLAEFADLPQGQAIRKYANMIEDAKSLDSLKQLRSSVDGEIGAAIDAGNGQLAMALGKVKGAIQRLERREILKAAIEAMPTKHQGEKAAKAIISDIKEVNKGWRALMSELETIAHAGSIKKIASPKHLIRILDDMPSEKIADRFFNTKNFNGLRDIKTHLPEEFELLRQHKLTQIAQKSLTKGEVDPVKLVRNLKAIGKESREILFGKRGEQMLQDMETVLNSMPSKVGASDTPRGFSWFQSVLNPTSWSREAHAMYNYMKLSGTTSKHLPSQETIKMLPRAASYGGFSALSNGGDQRRGQDKWAYDGYGKILESGGPTLTESEQNSPKIKRLLVRASDLTPGSKAWDRLMREIDAERGK